MKKSIVILMTLLAIGLTGCSKPQTAWITDLSEAEDTATKSKKDLLILFTGSDWNDESKEMITSVFTEDFFKKGSKNYILANADIVQDESLMDPSLLQVNHMFASKYGVQAMPYIVIKTSSGEIYASSPTEGMTLTPDGFFEFCDQFKDAKKNLIDLKKKVTSSKGVERAKNIDLFLEAVNPAQREDYTDFIREVPQLDADGSAGLKGKYQLQSTYLDAIDLYQNGNVTGAGDLFAALLEEGTLNPSQTQEACYMTAYMYNMSGTMAPDVVITWLEKAIEAEPGNPGAEQIRATIEQLKVEGAAAK